MDVVAQAALIMPLLLGLDIGTTSTIGILIDDERRDRWRWRRGRPTLHSDHANWAEEDPEQWWSNSCAIVGELLAKSGSRGRRDRRHRRHRHAAGGRAARCRRRLLRRSMQQNDARAIARNRGHEARHRRRAISFAAPAAASTSSWWRRSCAGSSATSRQSSRGSRRSSAPTTTSPGGSRARAASSTTGRSSPGWSISRPAASIPSWSPLPASRPDRLPPIRASQEIVGQVTAAAAAATGLTQGTPVVAGCADHVASAFLAGAVADGDMVLKFGGAGDILLAVAKPLTDPAPLSSIITSCPACGSATAAWPPAAAC